MSQILPYLSFNGNCREAMTFYKDCIGGELKMQSVAESPAAKQMPPEKGRDILHSTLTRGNFVLMASDHMTEGMARPGDTITLSIECDSEEEIQRLFSKLSAGGKVIDPLHTEFWGGTFGGLTDKYGIQWMFNYEHPDFKAPMGRPEVIVTHHFDAPRSKVYKAYTDPVLVAQWWGPKIFTTTVDIMNVRPGGEWRIIHRDAAGNQHAFRGVYHEVRPNERLVKTFEYENMPGHALLEIITFEDHEGGTRVVEKSVFQSVEERDGMVKTGMESGVKDSHDRFAALMQKTKQIEKA
jgi:uncharacterized glyoxalase superfamily protein PhnB/uncharacterized protein YndB with AHSA1/START domain